MCHRRDPVIVRQEKHVPAWRSNVRLARKRDPNRATSLRGDREVDEALPGVERVRGHAVTDQMRPANAARLR